MQDWHPTETAGDGKSLRNIKRLAPGEPSETLYISCPHCGYLNKTNRDLAVNKEGEGTKSIRVAVALYTGGTKTVSEPVRVSGCLLCRHDYTQSSYKKRFFSTLNLAGR